MLAAVIAALIAASVRVLDELSAPIVTAASVIPIVSLAPVLYTMFGADAQTARVLIAALAVFIPVYFNTLRGLAQVQPIHRDLMRSYAASRVAGDSHGDPARRAAVLLHRAAHRLIARRDLGPDRRVLRRPDQRPRHLDHLGGLVEQLPARLGVRPRRDHHRSRVLLRHPRSGDGCNVASRIRPNVPSADVATGPIPPQSSITKEEAP